MKIRKNQLLQLHGGSFPIDETIELDLAGRYTHIVGAEPAHFTGQAFAASGLYIVEGNISGVLMIECARCLKHFPYSYNVSLKETFIDRKETDLELDEEMEIHLLENDEINVNPYLESAILLSLPNALVCSDDCKGICPQCGTDRNQKDCGCVIERIDPRLAVLGELFGKQDK
ncbi:YceD family protein [Aneurinibacillus tyrosinisolvens]|uniref:YceD family protein n=1 Tax=Aneurinibacillus tyrosinisolvens TaxID=1443435 RepID=UPI00063F1482|nr:YceD family protein [Aneurinibacillus tyrosinisolvens]